MNDMQPAAADDDPGPGGATLLPSADDMLDGWTPGVAAPPSRRPTPAAQPAAHAALPARVGGHLVPPQVSSGKANQSTEDQSDRTARAANRPAAGQAPQTGSAAGKAAAPPGWRAKEKRKRDIGQQAGAKDWVQDEKRQLRQGGENYD
ncbi:hypothetical protein T492DRAFT_1025414 [Pavlovales sp. CCMP2436]|nr:hypothetical protein T492DRAFT_1025414 [Pavlovales sp. CCMP2436]